MVAAVDDDNFAGAATGTLTVAKAPTTVVLDDLLQTYDGTAKDVTALSAPGGLEVELTYNGQPEAPVAAGHYAVAAVVEDENYSGAMTGILTVAKAPAELRLGSLAQAYDGTRRNATATTVPEDLAVDFTYDGQPVAPTAIGSYAVVGTISDPNFAGSATGTLVVAKGLATVALGNLEQRFDGQPKSVVATTEPGGLTVRLTYDGRDAAPTAEGRYEVAATVVDSNYEGFAAGTLSVLAAIDPLEQWLQAQSLDPLDSRFAADEDVDGDGQTTWQEFVSDTDPSNPNDAFEVAGSYAESTGAIQLVFPTSVDRYYQLVYSTNLFAPALVLDLGWGGGDAGFFETNAPGQWFGTIRVRMDSP